MSIVDILIVIFLIVGFSVGFKNGFTKSFVRLIGFSVIVSLAFVLKNPVSELLMNTMPFFPFSGIIKGISVLNIALYETLAFALVLSVLTIILKIVTLTTNIFEKVLALTIVLGLPSKILGGIIELVKNYIIVFFVLYFLALPNFKEVSIVSSSKLKDPILKNTPVLSNVADTSIKVIDEFDILYQKYQKSENNDQFNLDMLDVLLKYKVTTTKTVKNLVANGKIKIKGIDKVLSKYEED